MLIPAAEAFCENPYSTGRAPHTMHERRLIDWEDEDTSRPPGASSSEQEDRIKPPAPDTVDTPATDVALGPPKEPAAPPEEAPAYEPADQTPAPPVADPSVTAAADAGAAYPQGDMGVSPFPPRSAFPSRPNYHPVPDDGSVPALDGPPPPNALANPRIQFAIGDAPASVLTPDSSFRRSLESIAGFLRKGFWFVLAAAGVWLATMFMLIVVYGFFNPPLSALMLIRMAGGQTIDQRWVPIEGISPNLVRAVISSEDARFCSHWGIDTDEIEAAIRRARGGLPRGASTMTMQLSKNLFLWPDKSYFRKALEAPLTLMIEAVWSKRRIAEVYLNVVEWGPGIFGAEAASRRHFKKPASMLSPAQAAALAVSLPNPIARQPSRHGPRLKAMSRTVQARMRAMGGGAACVLGG